VSRPKYSTKAAPHTRARALAASALVAALLAASAACSPAISPRTADLAKVGKLAGAARISPLSLGEAKLTTAGSPKPQYVSTSGGEIPPEGKGFAYIVGVMGSWELDLRYGVAQWAEIGVSYGFQRMGGEIRFGVVDEDRGQPFSLAASYGAYYSAIGNGPWARAGIDISKRFGRLAPMLNLYVSRGVNYHSSIVDLPGDQDCPKDSVYPCGVLIGARWYETRLTASIGIAAELDENKAFVLGLVPHVILSHSPPEEEARFKATRTLEHETGLHIVFGAQLPGW
jgi:hypothetical protein